jgi:hypothetical protein
MILSLFLDGCENCIVYTIKAGERGSEHVHGVGARPTLTYVLLAPVFIGSTVPWLTGESTQSSLGLGQTSSLSKLFSIRSSHRPCGDQEHRKSGYNDQISPTGCKKNT